jgi:hypothetical protein
MPKYGAQIKKPKKISANVQRTLINSALLKSGEKIHENSVILQRCWADYMALSDFRTRYQRNRNYLAGRQWNDIIYDDTIKSYTTEDSYIRRQGRVPLKNNLIASLMKNLIGQYRRNPVQSMVNSRAPEGQLEAEMVSNALQSVLEANRAIEKDVKACKIDALSGGIFQKLQYTYIQEQNRNNIKISNVNVNKLCFNTDIEDPDDIRRICQLYDIYIDDAVRLFASNKDEEARIKEIYSMASGIKNYWDSTNYLNVDKYDNISFLQPEQMDKCRVYEIWEIESEWRLRGVHDPLDASYATYPLSEEVNIKNENADRIKKGKAAGMSDDEIASNLITYEKRMDQFWTYKFMTPTGHVLAQGETPYEHKSHPFVISLFPLIDGEIRGWMEDVIDQQRQINRMLTLMDFIISTSSKNTLMVAKESVPDDMSPEDFAAEYHKVGGVIFFKSKPGVPLPSTIQNNSIPAGISEMLQIQMKMIEDVSGIQGPIQGKSAPSGTPASLYEQEAANASLNTVDFMQTFADFKRSRDLKIVKLIKQYYTEDQYLNSAGKEFSKEAKLFKAKQVANFDYDVAISHSFDSPTFRQAMENQLSQFVMNGLVPIETYLEVSSMPYAEKLLEGIKKMKEGAQQGDLQIPPEVQQAAQQGDPRAKMMIQQAMKTAA